jgi:hypothetical protein
LCDDRHPIEIGKLPNGEPDYVVRGFFVWNSEVGSKSLGIATLLFRTICENRILWGTSDYEELTLRHSKNAPMRFAGEVTPALESYSNEGTVKLLAGIKSARDAVVAKNDDEASDWLDRQGFTKPESKAVMDAVLKEEGHPARNVWDFVNGLTAVARGIQHTDERVAMERRAGKLMEKVAPKA